MFWIPLFHNAWFSDGHNVLRQARIRGSFLTTCVTINFKVGINK